MAVAPPRQLAMSEIHGVAAVVLDPEGDGDPYPVIHEPEDAVYAPLLLLAWGNPWIAVGPPPGGANMGPVQFTARLDVLCIAARVEPAPGYVELVRMLGVVVGRFRAAGLPWRLGNVTPPLRWDNANVAYLAARITYDVPCTIGE